MLCPRRTHPATISTLSSINPTGPTSATIDTNAAKPRKESRRLLFNFFGRPVMVLELTPVVFRIAWTVIVTAHLLCASFMILTAMAYWYFTNFVIGYYVRLWCPTTGNRDYAWYSVIFALVGSIHAIRVGKLLYISAVARQLVFRHNLEVKPRKHFQSTSGSFVLHIPTRLTSIFRRTRRVWNSLFSSRGFFGVENNYFFTLFVLREVVEVVSQTYQAYQSSHFLPHQWLNTCLVVLLVVNCWSTLVVEQFLQHKPALERVVALSADVFICIAMSVIVPVAIMTPYSLQFDVVSYAFKDQAKIHDPVFFSTFALESKLVFAYSIMDFGLKLLPHLTIYMSLVTITELLVKKSYRTRPTTEPELCHEPNKTLEKIAPLERVNCLNAITKILFCLSGALILGLYVHAAVNSQATVISGCRASTRPWFPNGKASCSSLVVNCHQRGTKSVQDSDFDKLDSVVLATISLVHCPELRMPSAFRQSSGVTRLQLNCGGVGTRISDCQDKSVGSIAGSGTYQLPFRLSGGFTSASTQFSANYQLLCHGYRGSP